MIKVKAVELVKVAGPLAGFEAVSVAGAEDDTAAGKAFTTVLLKVAVVTSDALVRSSVLAVQVEAMFSLAI